MFIHRDSFLEAGLGGVWLMLKLAVENQVPRGFLAPLPWSFWRSDPSPLGEAQKIMCGSLTLEQDAVKLTFTWIPRDVRDAEAWDTC